MGFRDPVTTAEGVDTGGTGQRVVITATGGTEGGGAVELYPSTGGDPGILEAGSSEVGRYSSLSSPPSFLGVRSQLRLSEVAIPEDEGAYLSTAGRIVMDGPAFRITGQLEGMADAFIYATAAAGTFVAGFTTLPLPGERRDSHGGHSPTVNPNRWTCPAGQGGLYAIDGQVVFQPGNILRNARILHNGAVFVGCAGNAAVLGPDQGVAAVTGTKLLWLNPGDYVELQGYSSASWATNVFADAASNLQVVRLR